MDREDREESIVKSRTSGIFGSASFRCRADSSTHVAATVHRCFLKRRANDHVVSWPQQHLQICQGSLFPAIRFYLSTDEPRPRELTLVSTFWFLRGSPRRRSFPLVARVSTFPAFRALERRLPPRPQPDLPTLTKKILWHASHWRENKNVSCMRPTWLLQKRTAPGFFNYVYCWLAGWLARQRDFRNYRALYSSGKSVHTGARNLLLELLPGSTECLILPALETIVVTRIWFISWFCYTSKFKLERINRRTSWYTTNKGCWTYTVDI